MTKKPNLADITKVVNESGAKLLKTIIRQRKTYKDVLALGKYVFTYTDLKATDEIKMLVKMR